MHQGTFVRRFQTPVGRLVRPAGFAMLLALGLGSVPAQAAEAPPAGIAGGVGAMAITQFYDERGGAPIWLAGGQIEPGRRLIELLARSDLDGLDPRRFNVRQLGKALEAAEDGNPRDVARADRMLSEAFIRYVADLRQIRPGTEWKFVDPEAKPRPVDARVLLQQAAATGSIDRFLETMPWMHESYSGLRRAYEQATLQGDSSAASRLRLNLERVRHLPAGPERFVLVNTAAQRLYMYENGRVVDWMRVVVGKAAQPTPMMAALIRFTALNPYWNVPDDLVAERIAPNVVKQGLGYLRSQRYVVLSDWSENPEQIDPSTIDWKAVEAGQVRVRVRQNPGPANAMGQMKFMFPNNEGVYLHDTPNKELLAGEVRMHSAGCVRLEDAPRLARWLYGRALEPKGATPEQKVSLDQPVPVYLAYLTAVPSGTETVFYDDIYGRDRARLAEAAVAPITVR